MIAIGEIAPDFTLPRSDAGPEVAPLTLSALRGGWVVLYFYPKADTPGCTTEALEFTRLAPEFAAMNATVLGISKDAPAKQGKFCAKHALGVAMLSDEASDTCEAYGVWGEKSMYGKTFMGITRATYLIDPEGRVAEVWPKVKVAGHAEEVLAAIRARG